MDTLYHYCSTDSFQAIVESRSIRLSSLSLSNDAAEGKLVRQVMRDLAAKDGIRHDVLELVEDAFDYLESATDGLGFCLSEEPDLLSQWRGYAADATGVSIGFSTDFLRDLEQPPLLRLHPVRYSASEHEELIEPGYRKLRNTVGAPNFELAIPKASLLASRLITTQEQLDDARFDVVMQILILDTEMYRLKGSAFREEKEWRLLRLADSETLRDECSYRSAGTKLVPFLSQPLDPDHHPIKEVILGAKHSTPEHVVKAFLNSKGFSRVEVRRSSASYR
jgi:Protein of unknown function (DUF2971)